MNKKYKITKLVALDEFVGHKVGDIKNIVERLEDEGTVIFVDEYGDYFLEEQLEKVRYV